MKDLFLIDGYNVINAWPQLIALRDNLGHARDKLIDMIAGYGAYQDLEVIIVFDAHSSVGVLQQQEITGDLTVIYTDAGETADSYIEKAAYTLVRERRRVFVVTSDWVEQMVILGAGAYRISSRELLEDVKRVERIIREGFTDTAVNYRRHELGNRLSLDVAARLEKMRKGQ